MDSRALSCLVGLFLTTSPMECLAQTELIVSGMVLDAGTLEPLPYAHILKNHQSATTPNGSGTFMVSIDHLDTLTVSHVSYNSHSQVIMKTQSSDTVTLAVFLERATKLLPEIEVTLFPATLEAFKQKVLEAEIIEHSKNMVQQHQAITFEMILGPKVTYDAYENYRKINQPTGFTLFSSGPNKGIGRALKSLRIGKKKK